MRGESFVPIFSRRFSSEAYRAAIPVEGARIVGVWFSEPVDLAHGRLNHQLWLDNCRFEAAVDLTGLTVDGWLSLEGSAVADHGSDSAPVSLAAMKIDGSINMKGVVFENVVLTGAKVGGHIYMIGATVAQTLTMDSLEVDQSRLISGPNALFQVVDLGGAKVGGQLTVIGATVTRSLTMNELGSGGQSPCLCAGPTLPSKTWISGARGSAASSL